MAKHLINPLGPATHDTENGALNNFTPRAAGLKRLAEGNNTIASYHKKLIKTKCQNIRALVAGAATTPTPWPFYFRTGENTNALRVHLGMVDTGYASAANPRVVITVTTAAGAVTDTATVYYNGRDAPATIPGIVDALGKFSPLLTGLSANTAYYVGFEVLGGARMLYMTACEEGPPHADDS